MCGVRSVDRDMVLRRRDANFRCSSPVEKAETSIVPIVDPQTLVSKCSRIDILGLAKWEGGCVGEGEERRRGMERGSEVKSGEAGRRWMGKGCEDGV